MNMHVKPAITPAAAVRNAIFDAEDAMLSVYDFALILHDYMTERGELDEDRRGALAHLTCELVERGRRLREHHQSMIDRVNAMI